MKATLQITCRDPIVSGDGRPFGAGQGNRMRSLEWPLPSVLAGSLRTTVGKAAHREFSRQTAEDLLQLELAGPFPYADRQLYFPAPEDCIVHPQRGPLRAAPQSDVQGGCDWPERGLRPVALTHAEAVHEFKPAETPRWWPQPSLAAWLAGEEVTFDGRFLRAAEIEDRTHVSLDSRTGVPREGQLFTTSALALTALRRYHAFAAKSLSHEVAAITLAARVRGGTWCGEAAGTLNTFHPLGGERRLVHWKASPDTDAWSCPRKIRDALAQARRVRMVLATPAVFRDGWKPAWLDHELVGTPPGTEVALRLAAVSIRRWRAVSGWSLASLPGQPRGPKPVRRMVPAGGVYFFEIAQGNALDLADRWLEAVSDGEQDRRDGFGLTTWGIW